MPCGHPAPTNENSFREIFERSVSESKVWILVVLKLMEHRAETILNENIILSRLHN